MHGFDVRRRIIRRNGTNRAKGGWALVTEQAAQYDEWDKAVVVDLWYLLSLSILARNSFYSGRTEPVWAPGSRLLEVIHKGLSRQHVVSPRSALLAMLPVHDNM
jgi:hypothetical protein